MNLKAQFKDSKTVQKYLFNCIPKHKKENELPFLLYTYLRGKNKQ